MKCTRVYVSTCIFEGSKQSFSFNFGRNAIGGIEYEAGVHILSVSFAPVFWVYVVISEWPIFAYCLS